jgi:hypothetical protein
MLARSARATYQGKVQYRMHVPVSPASPENAISECEFSARVLSSDALRIVAPRMAAFDAAMIVKSFPVIPSRTSLFKISFAFVDSKQGLQHGAEYCMVAMREEL